MNTANRSVDLQDSSAEIIQTGDKSKINITSNLFKIEVSEKGSVRVHDASNPVIDLSYYRLDRNLQLSKLEIALSENTDPPCVCLLAGDPAECLEKFLECIASAESHYRLFRIRDKPLLKYIKWPWDEKNPERVRERVLREFANEVQLSPDLATPEAINRKTRDKPLLVRVQITSKCFWSPKSDGDEIAAFTQFWKEWPPRERLDAPLVVFVSLLNRQSKEQTAARGFFQRLSLWFRREEKSADHAYDLIAECLNACAPNRVALPPLCPVEFDHVVDWADEADIRARCRQDGCDPAAAINEIYQERSAIPMQEIAKTLSERFPIPRNG